MHWIENAIANVNLEALNDMILWIINALTTFRLDIGSGESLFEETVSLDVFVDPIFLLAYFIIITATLFKLWVTMMSPFDEAESPGAIAVRFVGSMVGTAASLEFFKLAEKAFNEIYVRFINVYVQIITEYKEIPAATPAEENKVWTFVKGLIRIIGTPFEKIATATTDMVFDNTKAFNFGLFGGDSLINPENYSNAEAPLGVLLLEFILGCTLVIAFMRLVLEVYERYVLIGVMYFTSPLAFSSIIVRDSQIFRNWIQMLVGQFILMCTNLVFLGGFIGTWGKLLADGADKGYFFETTNDYFATMLLLIGWLSIGQKLDQHLKGAGLSTAQTGAGLMGALAGGAVLARAAAGMIGNAGGVIHRSATGNTLVQRAYRDGTGLYRNLPGAGKGDLKHQNAMEVRNQPQHKDEGPGTDGAKDNAISLGRVPTNEKDVKEFGKQLSQNRRDLATNFDGSMQGSFNNFDSRSLHPIEGTNEAGLTKEGTYYEMQTYGSNVGAVTVGNNYEQMKERFESSGMTVAPINVGGEKGAIAVGSLPPVSREAGAVKPASDPSPAMQRSEISGAPSTPAQNQPAAPSGAASASGAAAHSGVETLANSGGAGSELARQNAGGSPDISDRPANSQLRYVEKVNKER